ncbi:hypothetical protein BCR37DRAFT_395069 [Protomyces lactucae-debilis]|uniref:Zn(2)-C6 fungal-type domain-containing protein n=1 Tax=Protomyces lactucae-debilis TaxID=2754530 RepID=A0A1Y2EZC6_PROLT|nr:uncharacterized protein BCR37DRAFT_395069 [Protomyces lactucae-debilis]ORY76981.1 hypothetical protein BCR37DRAFT_395069 [Protomyces lactucae-debilis]
MTDAYYNNQLQSFFSQLVRPNTMATDGPDLQLISTAGTSPGSKSNKSSVSPKAKTPRTSNLSTEERKKPRATRHRSTGCGTCRMRKIKCDEQLPYCRNCQRTERECLGYRTPEELANPQLDRQRLVTRHKQRAEKKPDIAPTNHSNSTHGGVTTQGTTPESQLFSMFPGAHGTHSDTHVSQIDPQSSMDVVHDAQPIDLIWNAQALPSSFIRLETFFFRRFITSVWLHSYSDLWRNMLPSVLNTSAPLYHSVLALSAMYMFKNGIDRRAKDSAMSHYAVAVQQLQAALYNPQEAMKDTTLMATVIMGFYEMLDKDDHKSWCAHTKGAQQLIRLRGPRATSSGLGKMMYVTLRGFETVRAILEYEETLFAEETWTIPSANPATRFHFAELLGPQCPPVSPDALATSAPPDYASVLYMLGSKVGSCQARAHKLYKSGQLTPPAKCQVSIEVETVVEQLKQWRMLLPPVYDGREAPSTLPLSPYKMITIFDGPLEAQQICFYCAFMLQAFRIRAKYVLDDPTDLPPEAQDLARKIIKVADYLSAGLTTTSLQITWPLYAASIALCDREEQAWARRMMKAIASEKRWAIAKQALKAHSVEARPHSSSVAYAVLDELRSIEQARQVTTPSRSRSLVEFLIGLSRPTSTDLAEPAQAHDPFAHVTAQLTAATDASKAASEIDTEALMLLAELNFHGNYTYPRDYHKALHYYRQLAELNGNETAHEQLGFLYATGIGGVERDQGLALLHHAMAAEQGSIRSSMTLGYRYWHGIGTAPNCTIACDYYATAADQAINWIRQGPPGGLYFRRKAYAFAEELGGLYGARMSQHHKLSVSVHAKDIDDVIDYFTYLAEKNDAQAAFNLAKLHRDGSRTVEVDHVKALYWFRRVARTYWTKDGKTVKNVKAMRYHAETAAWIGQAYLRGEGTEQDFEKARIWFQRGLVLGDTGCQYGLALMHLQGLGTIPKDREKAISFLQAASDAEHHMSQLVLGKILIEDPDITFAVRLLESAAKGGKIEAFYFLAQMYEQGIGRERSCQMATQYYKMVAECAESLHSTIPFGNKAYQEGRTEDAIIAMMIAAESGYEKGQVNVAYLLDQHRHSFSLKDSFKRTVGQQIKLLRQRIGTAPPDPVNALQEKEAEEQPSLADELALLYYTRSASQNNWEALVKAADYHLEGYGTSASPEEAVTLWQAAADSRAIPLALWNLGWSYENGVGVEQDFHMAKRYYDACLELDKRANLAVTLSLFMLRLRSAWNTVTGGSVRSIKKDEDAPVAFSFKAIWTGFKHFWRSQWDLPTDEAYPEEDFLDEDFPSSGEDLYESLLILSICLFVAGAVYVRTNWNNRRLDQQAAAQHGGGGNGPPGAPPAAADPHMAAFIGGGVRSLIRRRAAKDQSAKEAAMRPAGTRAAGAGGSNATQLRLYTDDAPGLKVDPLVVMVLSVAFVGSVFALHIIAKIISKFSA